MRTYLSFNARRATAALLDGGLLAVAASPFAELPVWLVAVLGVTYRIICHLIAGTTVGKSAMGLELVSQGSVARTILRDALVGISIYAVDPDLASPLGLLVFTLAVSDLAVGLVRRDHRTLHDLAGSTRVIRRGPPNQNRLHSSSRVKGLDVEA